MSQNEVDADGFESMLDSGEVGGGITVAPGEVIGLVDGVEVRYLVDTSPRVADVLSQEIEGSPEGDPDGEVV
jgi:hypothetical protein